MQLEKIKLRMYDLDLKKVAIKLFFKMDSSRPSYHHNSQNPSMVSLGVDKMEKASL